MTGIHEQLQSFAPRTVRRFAIPMILFWVGVAFVVNTVAPQLEAVGKAHSVSMSPNDAPSMQAMKRVGQDFHEFDSDSSVMIVLESEAPLGGDAHRFYDEVLSKLRRDTKHVEHVQDFWSDPLTAAGSQSNDGKAAYVQVYLAGNQGQALANESVEALEAIVDGVHPPPGLKVFVTGASALASDMHHAGDKSVKIVTAVTGVVILVMLLFVYRSITTVLLVLLMVGLELGVTRGIIAVLAYHDVIGLSTFAVNLLTMLTIAAGTDYAIFLIGRYQEARQAGERREASYYSMFRGTAHVVLGSGLTIAGALLCLSLTRSPYFNTLGPPSAIGMVVAVLTALTLGPAVITVATRFGLFEPKRAINSKGWRRIGTAIVRWPGPILAITCALCLLGLLALAAYEPNYNDRIYLPPGIPANVGYAAADRHFSAARMNPELVLVETDHDVRNPAGMLVIDRITRNIFRTDGVARVQSITRPLGTPIEHTSIPYMVSMQGITQKMNESYLQDRMADMLVQADQMQTMIGTMEKMLSLMNQLNAVTHDMVVKTKDMATTVEELRDHISDFDDFFRPLRSYFYWERHCFDIPACWSLRSIFDTLDGIDAISDQLGGLVDNLDKLDSIMPQLMTLLPPMLDTMKTMRTMMLTMYATQKGMQDQMAAAQRNSAAMGEAFDASKNDDSFYLPPEVFGNPDFQRGLKMFVSQDGKAVRFIVSHLGDPLTKEGISHIAQIRNAAFQAMKGTPWEGSTVFVAGSAATIKDLQEASNYDLLIAGTAALCLIFIIMLLITRSVLASLVIVGTVLISLGASLGLSVLIWQHILGIQLEWLVVPITAIILLAVGSDYNLLLVSRFREESGAGLKTGIIRSMAGTGSVVTAAGLVFSFTMGSMVASDLLIIGQMGAAIGLGLLFDTIVVRSFMTPAIAALLGRWFWWPQMFRSRPARYRTVPVPSVDGDSVEQRRPDSRQTVTLTTES